MSYSRDIAEAKRRARASARTNGTSYQAELEREAKALGYESWAELISGGKSQALPGEHPSQPEATDSLAVRLSQLSKFVTTRMGALPVMTTAGSLLATYVLLGLAIMTGKAESKQIMKDNFLYNEEKALAAVIPGLQFASYDRVSYVTAWNISPGKRKVYITIYDWRSMHFLEDQLSDNRYKNAPLVRFQGVADCEKGIFENPNLHIAENLVSPSLKKMTSDAPDEKLSEQETDVMCGEDVLRKTKDIEAFHLE